MKLKRRDCSADYVWEPQPKIPRQSYQKIEINEEGFKPNKDICDKRKFECTCDEVMEVDSENHPIKRKRTDEFSQSTRSCEDKGVSIVSENSFFFWGSKNTKDQDTYKMDILEHDNNKMDIPIDTKSFQPGHPEFSCFSYWKPPFPELTVTDIG